MNELVEHDDGCLPFTCVVKIGKNGLFVFQFVCVVRGPVKDTPSTVILFRCNWRNATPLEIDQIDTKEYHDFNTKRFV